MIFSFFDISQGRVHIWLRIGLNKAFVNDREQELDLAPFLRNKRTLVPLRFIGEAFGATVDWTPNDKIIGQGMIMITFHHHAKRLKMHTEVPIIYIETHINEPEKLSVESYEIDVAPFIVKPQNRTVVPLRFIAEAMQAEVQWSPNDQSIEIFYDG